jgi:hypothetical protein
MSAIHEVILRDGRQLARSQVSLDERRFVDLSAAAIAELGNDISFTHSAWCWASFPRRQIPNGQSWVSHGPRYSIFVDPGLQTIDGWAQPDGVPFGSRSRLIMIYVQTVATGRNSADVLLCTTLNSWMQEMGLAVGGNSYELVREQIRRFVSCRITLADRGIAGHAPDSSRERRFLIKDHNTLPDNPCAEVRVLLGTKYTESLQSAPVQLWQPALKLLANQSLSLDAYVWLAGLLPTLRKPTMATWTSLHHQFGWSFKNKFQFKPRFLAAIKMAIAVYPNAEVEVDRPEGVVLRPSQPPVGQPSCARRYDDATRRQWCRRDTHDPGRGSSHAIPHRLGAIPGHSRKKMARGQD